MNLPDNRGDGQGDDPPPHNTTLSSWLLILVACVGTAAVTVTLIWPMTGAAVHIALTVLAVLLDMMRQREREHER